MNDFQLGISFLERSDRDKHFQREMITWSQGS